MDKVVMRQVESYVSFLRTQFPGDTIPTVTYKVLVYDDMEEARKLSTDQFQAVLNNVANFAHTLYDTGSTTLKPYARHYVIALIKELTRLNSDSNVLQVLKLIKQYDYEAWEMCITHCSSSIRDAALSAERILRFIRDAIYGSITGAIIGAGIIAVRMWLKI